MALNLLVEGISITSIKIRKLLITVGMYHTPMSVFIHLLFKNLKFEFVRIKEIEGELKKVKNLWNYISMRILPLKIW